MEIWEACGEFDQYLVSPDGEIMNRLRVQPKRPRLNAQGDMMIDLNRDCKTHTRKLSLLVAHAYLEPPPSDAYNSVIHLNGDRSDCRAINLAWRPRWFVVEYNRMFKERPYNVSVKLIETAEIFGTLREACMKYGLIEERAYVDMQNGEPTFPQGFHLMQLN